LLRRAGLSAHRQLAYQVKAEKTLARPERLLAANVSAGTRWRYPVEGALRRQK
jgi:hypothetical protein